jgi:chromosome segregation ATPase
VYDQKLRSFLDEMEASARWKPRAKQFDSKLRMEQQKEFITVIQGRLLELKQQLPSFHEACLEVERDMYLQLRTTSDRAALIERELESAREELKRIQEKERSTTEQLIRLQTELAALQHQRDGISELQGPMMQRLQELEREQPLLQEQLARKRDECEHLQLELQNTKAQMTEVRGFKDCFDGLSRSLTPLHSIPRCNSYEEPRSWSWRPNGTL